MSGPDSKPLDNVSFLDKCEGQQRTEFREVAKLWPLHIQIKELSPVPPRDAEGEFPWSLGQRLWMDNFPGRDTDAQLGLTNYSVTFYF